MKGFGWFCVILGSASFLGAAINGNSVPVSYTHLTLPTTERV